jgi:hypothetical protein
VTPAFYALLLGFLGFITTFMVLRRRIAAAGPDFAMPVTILSRASDVVAAVICFAAFAVLMFYLAAPGYLDHVEPLVAVTSWMYLRGEPIFPDWLHGEGLYGDNKGAALYLVNAALLQILPTIWASKLAGWTAGIAGVAFQFWTLRRLNLSRATALRLTAVTFLVSSIEFYTFSDRADSFIYSLVSASFALALLVDGPWAPAAIGVLAGFTTAMKLDAVFYFVPVLVWLVSNTANNGQLRAAGLFSGFAVAAFFLPFAAMGASVAGFLSYIWSSAHHGISLDLLVGNALFAFALLAIAAFGHVFAGAPMDRRARTFLFSLVLCLLVVVVGGAKPGAGMHHLFPFAPAAVFAFGHSLTLLPEPHIGAGRLAIRLAFFAVVSSFGAGTAYLTYQLAEETIRADRSGTERRADLVRLQTRYPDAEMGVSDIHHYDETFLYPELAFRGGKLSLISATWMDLSYAGVSERYAMSMLDNCRVPAWILPHAGRPFTLTSYYTRQPLYSRAFRARFFAAYRLVEQGLHYDVWTCREVPQPT